MQTSTALTFRQTKEYSLTDSATWNPHVGTEALFLMVTTFAKASDDLSDRPHFCQLVCVVGVDFFFFFLMRTVLHPRICWCWCWCWCVGVRWAGGATFSLAKVSFLLLILRRVLRLLPGPKPTRPVCSVADQILTADTEYSSSTWER